MMKVFRITGLLEGLSLLVLLFVAMPLKYVYGEPIAVRMVGSLHGFLFLAYIGLLVPLSQARQWPGRVIALGFVAAVLPFGTFVYDRYLTRRHY